MEHVKIVKIQVLKTLLAQFQGVAHFAPVFRPYFLSLL